MNKAIINVCFELCIKTYIIISYCLDGVCYPHQNSCSSKNRTTKSICVKKNDVRYRIMVRRCGQDAAVPLSHPYTKIRAWRGPSPTRPGGRHRHRQFPPRIAGGRGRRRLARERLRGRCRMRSCRAEGHDATASRPCYGKSSATGSYPSAPPQTAASPPRGTPHAPGRIAPGEA
jgi:hypothetical protein